MRVSDSSKTFLDAFEEVSCIDIDEYGRKKLNIHMMKTNANEFAYDALIDKLIEPMVDFSVSRVTKKKLESAPGHLVKRLEKNLGKLKKIRAN